MCEEGIVLMDGGGVKETETSVRSSFHFEFRIQRITDCDFQLLYFIDEKTKAHRGEGVMSQPQS